MSIDQVLADKLESLYERRTAGMKFGLEVERELLAQLGNPQDSYAVIHVAGTNGKGSVCALVASVLEQVGMRVGLYVSPHLVEFNERITVNGVQVTDEELLEVSQLIDDAIPSVLEACGREPTFFEYATAMAFKLFQAKGIQVAVVETGMGGRLDATSVVHPLVSAITRISLEHTEFLGPDLAAIAEEKAGIIEAGRPVVCGAMDEEAREVIRAKASEKGCLFRDVEQSVSASLLRMSLAHQVAGVATDSRTYGQLETKLIGLHQIENVATAVAIVEETERALGVEFPLVKIKQGFAKAEWLGRFHVLSKDPPVILDGAHNPGASAVLGASLRRLLKKRPLALVLGMCDDKDLASFLKGFRGISKVWTVTIKNERAVPGDQLAERVRICGPDCESEELSAAMEKAEKWAADNGGAVCVAGSLFLVGEVLCLKGVT